jgi:uncharacterized protein
MLAFDRSSVDAGAVRVDGRLSPSDPVWEGRDSAPCSDLVVTGRLSSAGAGRYYFSGSLQGEIALDCRRCLTAVTLPVTESLHFLFAQAGDEETDESDVYPLDPRARLVDLRPAIREQWILAAPAFALCREDCKGLCPQCGADLNQGPCGCSPDPDRRPAARMERPAGA